MRVRASRARGSGFGSSRQRRGWSRSRSIASGLDVRASAASMRDSTVLSAGCWVLSGSAASTFAGAARGMPARSRASKSCARIAGPACGKSSIESADGRATRPRSIFAMVRSAVRPTGGAAKPSDCAARSTSPETSMAAIAPEAPKRAPIGGGVRSRHPPTASVSSLRAAGCGGALRRLIPHRPLRPRRGAPPPRACRQAAGRGRCAPRAGHLQRAAPHRRPWRSRPGTPRNTRRTDR